MEKLYDIDELSGCILMNAIYNMICQLLDDGNQLIDITLDRIYAEIDSVGLKFNDKGDIVL